MPGCTFWSMRGRVRVPSENFVAAFARVVFGMGDVGVQGCIFQDFIGSRRLRPHGCRSGNGRLVVLSRRFCGHKIDRSEQMGRKVADDSALAAFDGMAPAVLRMGVRRSDRAMRDDLAALVSALKLQAPLDLDAPFHAGRRAFDGFSHQGVRRLRLVRRDVPGRPVSAGLTG